MQVLLKISSEICFVIKIKANFVVYFTLIALFLKITKYVESFKIQLILLFSSRAI